MKIVMQSFDRWNMFKAFDTEQLKFGPQRNLGFDPKNDYQGEYTVLNGKLLAFFAEDEAVWNNF